MRKFNVIILSLLITFFSLGFSFAQEIVNDDFDGNVLLFTEYLNNDNKYIGYAYRVNYYNFVSPPAYDKIDNSIGVTRRMFATTKWMKKGPNFVENGPLGQKWVFSTGRSKVWRGVHWKHQVGIIYDFDQEVKNVSISLKYLNTRACGGRLRIMARQIDENGNVIWKKDKQLVNWEGWPGPYNRKDRNINHRVWKDVKIEPSRIDYLAQGRPVNSIIIYEQDITSEPGSGYIDNIIINADSENEAPIADAGPDQTLEIESYEGTAVALDGSQSTDIDSSSGTTDDIELFEWYENGIFLGKGEIIEYTFPLGEHIVKLVVTDYEGQTDEDKVVIVVEDTIPPEVTISASHEILWPPNNKLRDVEIKGEATDISGDISLYCLVEDEYGEIEYGLDSFNFNEIIQLIASRNGNDKDGRAYAISVTATDGSGNSNTASAIVLVPHDQGKNNK